MTYQKVSSAHSRLRTVTRYQSRRIYVKKVVNRVTCIGALALTFIAALPVVLTLSGLFGANSSLAIGGTGLIIAVGVSLELNDQVNGLLAGKTFDEVQASAGRE